MTNPSGPLKAPFPWAGGKSRVADEVWSRLGDVDNFIEPFAGTLATLLRRPAEHFKSGYRVETVNDLNHYLVNFWRAVKADPDKVAEYADWPVHESDLHARHKWLVRSREVAEWRERMRTDPDCFDAKIAGWWVWGQCAWIGHGFCDVGADWQVVPMMYAENGVCGRPQLTDAYDIGRGVNASAKMPRESEQVPRLGERGGIGYGVHQVGPTDGTCSARRAWLADWMRSLADRLRLVRTCYGHWSRVCDSDSTLTRLGTTGVMLDPPYPEHSADGKKSRAKNLYATDKGSDLNELRDEILAWCQKWGPDKQIRIALCCYENDGYESLLGDGWELYSWEAQGGYGNQGRKGKGKAANAKRERILFSPGCVRPVSLFAGVA